MRAKEIVNKDSGVANTYHLMLLFDQLHNEAVGRESEAEKMFSKRKVRISAPAHQRDPDAQPHPQALHPFDRRGRAHAAGSEASGVGPGVDELSHDRHELPGAEDAQPGILATRRGRAVISSSR